MQNLTQQKKRKRKEGRGVNFVLTKKLSFINPQEEIKKKKKKKKKKSPKLLTSFAAKE